VKESWERRAKDNLRRSRKTRGKVKEKESKKEKIDKVSEENNKDV
jgi:hypothetical protein